MTEEFAELNGVEVFSTGTWKGSKTLTVTGQMLDDMVRSFNELSDKVSGYRPPLKLGHVESQRFIGQNGGSGAPALGWVKALRRVGDKIVADFSDVPLGLLDMIKRKLYNHVSIEILPAVEHQGSKFKSVLAAVAVLGAELPAVKGLKELSATLFDDASDVVKLSEKENGMFTQEQVNALTEAAVAKAKVQFAEDHQATIDAANEAVEKAVKDANEATEARERAEAALATFAEDQSKKDVVAAVDAAIKDGKVLPAEKDSLVAMGQSMTGKIKFGDKDVSAVDHFKASLAARPKIVKFGEEMQGTGEGDKQFDNAADEVDRRAKAKMQGNKDLTYKDAVKVVLSEDDALKDRYARPRA